MALAELHLPRGVAYVGLARLIVTAAARLAGMAEERLEDLKIAVSEAATRAVTAGGRDEPVILAFGVHRGAFEVHVLGAVGQPQPSATQDWLDEGDLGLTLIEGLADEVVFPEASHSQLVLRFDVARDRAAAGVRPPGGSAGSG